MKILIDIICFFFFLAEEISISHLSIPMAWELAGSEEDHLNEVELRATRDPTRDDWIKEFIKRK